MTDCSDLRGGLEALIADLLEPMDHEAQAEHMLKVGIASQLRALLAETAEEPGG